MAEDTTKAQVPPYIPFRTFLNLLERLQQSGIPLRIDRTYWGSFLSGSVGPSVVTGLRFLGLLTNDNEPTDELERLVKDSDERQRLLADILRRRYAAIFEAVVDLTRTTHGQLEKAFHTVYKVENQTRRKAITFFVHAVKYAEIPISSHITDGARTRRSGPRTSVNGRKSQPAVAASAPKEQPVAATPDSVNSDADTGDVKSITLRSGGKLTLSVSVKWLDLPKDDRNFVFELTDMLAEYEQRAKDDNADEKEDEAAVLASSSS